VLARRDQLAAVLDRLLDNAARHAQSPILAVTVERRGDQVEIAVEDEGPGIPPEIADSMLEWGARGATSQGQGIGLNVLLRLVTSMGGQVRIGAGELTGTRVSVTLAAADAGPDGR
jgi:signal transduction histidine kinase